MGASVELVVDVGVAGIHRVLRQRERLDRRGRGDRGRRDGRGAAERRGRAGGLPGDRVPDEHRLRGGVRRRRGAV